MMPFDVAAACTIVSAVVSKADLHWGIALPLRSCRISFYTRACTHRGNRHERQSEKIARV